VGLARQVDISGKATLDDQQLPNTLGAGTVSRAPGAPSEDQRAIG
jgi:hypothetical protein